MPPDRLAKELVKRCFDLHALQLWQEFDDEAAIALRIPGCEHASIASLAGAGGMNFEFNLHRGVDALSDFRDWLHIDEEDGQKSERDMALVGFTMAPLSQIPPDNRKILTAAGFSARRESMAPYLIQCDIARPVREPNRTWQKRLLYAINAIILAHEQGVLKPESVFSDQLLTLEIEGTPYRLQVEASHKDIEPTFCGHNFDIEDYAEEILAFEDNDDIWEMGFIPIDGKDTDATLMIVNQSKGTIRQMIVMPEETYGNAGRFLVETILRVNPEGYKRCPAKIILNNQALLDAVLETTDRLKIMASFAPSPPELARQRASFEQLAFDRSAEEENSPSKLETREEWREINAELCRLLSKTLENQQRTGKRLERHFLGRPLDSMDINDEEYDLRMGTMLSWASREYRPGKNSKTATEVLLASGDLSDLEQIALSSRGKNPISFFRIESAHPGISVTLLNIVNGDRWVVEDIFLSNADSVDSILCAQIELIDGHNFVSLYSEPIPLPWWYATLEYLMSLGLRLHNSGIETGSEYIGRLWDWREEIMMSEEPEESRLPVEEMPAGTMASLKARINQNNWAWLDKKIGALDHMSPRAAVQVPRLRTKVIMLINTMPGVGGPGQNYPTDRQELLNEIGLGEN